MRKINVSFLRRLAAFGKKNLPTILTWGSAISTVGVGLFTAKATIKAVRTYDALKAEKGDDLRKTDVLKKVIPYYIPAIGFTAASVTCSFTSNHINVKRQRILSGALLASNEALSALRKKVMDKAEDIIEERAEEVRKEPIKQKECIQEEIITVYDVFADYSFETTMSRLRDAQLDVNRELNNSCWGRGFYPYENYFEHMKVAPPKWARAYTWRVEDMELGYESTWVEFVNTEKKSKDGGRLIVVTYIIDPEIDGGWIAENKRA